MVAAVVASGPDMPAMAETARRRARDDSRYSDELILVSCYPLSESSDCQQHTYSSSVPHFAYFKHISRRFLFQPVRLRLAFDEVSDLDRVGARQDHLLDGPVAQSPGLAPPSLSSADHAMQARVCRLGAHEHGRTGPGPGFRIDHSAGHGAKLRSSTTATSP